MRNSSVNVDEFTFKHEYTLNLLENRLQVQNDDFTAYESKAQNIINTGALLVAVCGIFIANRILNYYEKLSLVLFFGSILVTLFYSLKVLFPQNWTTVLSPKREKLELFLKETDEVILKVYYERICQTYIEALDGNTITLDRKAKYVKYAFRGLFVEVINLMIIIMIGFFCLSQ